MSARFIRPVRTFLDVPFVAPDALRANDIAIFTAAHGTPYPSDSEVGYDVATGSDTAPQAIRDAANQSSTDIDHFDFDLGGPLLGDGRRRLVDCGDLALSIGDGAANRAAIRAATTGIRTAGAIPILIGGDDSVPIPWFAAFGPETTGILQLDAHIDWRDTIGGEREGYSSTMRRASECTHAGDILQVGMRGVGSARAVEVQAAHSFGARLITVSEARRMGVEALLALLDRAGPFVIQIDCDVFDPSVCPGVNATTPGGFRFEEVAEIVRGAIARRRCAGVSLVELAPARDPSGTSAIVAARLLCNAIGAIARSG